MPTKKRPTTSKKKPIKKLKRFKGPRLYLATAVVLLVAGLGIAELIHSFANSIAPTNTYTNWYWPSTSTGFNDFAWNVTPRTDPSPDGYFWSNQFGFLGGNGGYFGLQTEGSNPTGKIAIFSIWDAISASSPGVTYNFTNEGTGWSARIPYNWSINTTYHLQVIKAGTGVWQAYVTNNSTGLKSYVGQINVPTAWGGLTWSDSWTEMYGPTITSCSQLNHSVVDFTGFTANSGTVLPSSHVNSYSNPVNCTNATLYDISGGVRQEVGTGDWPAWPDTIAPSVPSGLQAAPASSSQINLSWTASTDNSRVANYRVYRNGVLIAQPTTTYYYDGGLTTSTSYSYSVSAVDLYGNVSVTSSPVSATTFATNGKHHH